MAATTPLKRNALTTLAIAKEELGVAAADKTKNDQLRRYINAASQLVETVCNRPYGFWKQRGFVEAVKGYGDAHLVLTKRPIVAVSAITGPAGSVSDPLNDVVDIAQVHIEGDGRSGLLWREGGWWWTAQQKTGIVYEKVPLSEEASYTVTYDGGYVTAHQAQVADPGNDEPPGELAGAEVTLPDDLHDAVIKMITMRWKGRGKVADPAVTAESMQSYSVTYGAKSNPFGLPVEIMSVLALYGATTEGSFAHG